MRARASYLRLLLIREPLARRSSEGSDGSFLLPDGRVYARGRGRLRHEGGGNDQHRGARQRRGSKGKGMDALVFTKNRNGTNYICSGQEGDSKRFSSLGNVKVFCSDQRSVCARRDQHSARLSPKLLLLIHETQQRKARVLCPVSREYGLKSTVRKFNMQDAVRWEFSCCL